MAVIDKKGVLHGSVSNIVYRNWRDLNVVQLKPHEVRQTLASKEASLEFGLCSSTARVIREAFSWAYRGYDGGMINRFSSAVRRSVYASSKARGERDIHDADLSFLKGFQFNTNSPLDKVLRERPTAEMDEENRVRVQLPAIRMSDIKAPFAHQYVVRLLLVAFDFRKEVFSYVGKREIKINDQHPFEGGELVFDEVMPEGRLLVLSISVHGYKEVLSGDLETVNSAAWSPAELLGAWQLAREESDQSADQSVKPARQADTPYRNIPFSSESNQMKQNIAGLREEHLKKQKPEPRRPNQEVAERTVLPTGDVSFKRGR
ncbi:hypothetical protein [Pedobacter sp. SYSU D00535]|uniref:hypothetical protein n=1 Tax=Pedobacter sp. SYSU D00535 TaxID=2810308 RepID=UPI001A95B75A|nr:hypothetical protein [Pedobacter sp. SYSU D00535]